MQIIPDLKKLDSQIYKILVLSNLTLHNRKYLYALGIQRRAILRRERRERTNPRHLIDRTGELISEEMEEREDPQAMPIFPVQENRKQLTLTE